MTGRTDILRLAYEAGLRGIQEQRQTLSEVRALTGQTVALGTAASGVLGGLALDAATWSVWAAVAIAAWATAAATAVFVFAPRDGWTFNLDSRKVAEWVSNATEGATVTLAEAYAAGAEHLAAHHDSNGQLLIRMQAAQLAVLAAVAVSLASWVGHLAVS